MHSSGANKLVRKKYLSVLAYLVVAAVTAAAFNDASNARQDIATGTRASAAAACKHQNDVRDVLTEIIKKGEPPIRGFVKRGLLTQREGENEIARSEATISKLAQLDCSSAKSPIPK